MFIELNGFRIKENIIPKKAYLYTYLPLEKKDKRNFFKKIKGIWKASIIAEENEKIILASLSKLDEDTFTLRFMEKVPFENLKRKNQEELIYFLLKNKGKIKEILDQNLSNILKDFVKKSKTFKYVPTIKYLRVKKVNNDFVLFVDIGYKVKPLKNLYSLFYFKWEKLKEFEGKEILYSILNYRYDKVILEKVILNPDKESIKGIYNYLLKKYKNLSLPSLEELKNTCLIKIKYKTGESYLTIPNVCYFLPKTENINLKFSNEERKEILKKIVKNIPFLENDLYRSKCFSLSKISYVVKDNKGKQIINSLKETINYSPLYIPSFLKNQKVKIIFLSEENLEEGQEKLVKNFLKAFIKIYNKTKLKEVSFLHKTFKGNIEKLLQRKFKDNIYFLVFFGNNIDKEIYVKYKNSLLKRKVISQFIDLNTLYNKAIYELLSKNLILNIATKLGIRLYFLKNKLPYDYIIGFDIGNNKFGKRSKAASAIVYNAYGEIKNIFLNIYDTDGEIFIDIDRFLEDLFFELKMEKGKVLILKDGKFYSKEIKRLLSSRELNDFNIHLANVKKRHGLRILSDTGKKYVQLNKDEILLLPHTIKGANSVLIDNAYKIYKGNIEKLNLDFSFANTIYTLTKLNISALFAEKNALRLPANIHYADKLLKHISLGMDVNVEFLKEGLLYFI